MPIRLLSKRPAWCLTVQGWCVVLATLNAVLLLLLFGSGSFLSPTVRVEADVLVVEGWLPDYALKDAVEEFHRGKYRYVITAGSPLLSGYYLSDRKTSADLAAETLIKVGMSSNSIVRAPGPLVLRGRSLAHAKAVAAWLETHDPLAKGINVYTIGVHSRRTWMTFKAVSNGRFPVGVIAHPDAAFDLNRWWTSSEGIKAITTEGLGYLWMFLRGVE